MRVVDKKKKEKQTVRSDRETTIRELWKNTYEINKKMNRNIDLK